jgi:hypothetical protein
MQIANCDLSFCNHYKRRPLFGRFLFAVSSAMKAAFINKTGPAESIVYGDLPAPEPQGSEVRVNVRAVAVNPVDTYIRDALEIPFHRRMRRCRRG